MEPRGASTRSLGDFKVMDSPGPERICLCGLGWGQEPSKTPSTRAVFASAEKSASSSSGEQELKVTNSATIML